MIETLIFENIYIKNFLIIDNNEKELILKMRNHENIRKYMYNKSVISEIEHTNFIQKLKNNESNLYFIVYLNELISNKQINEVIGVIYLNNIDLINKKAIMGIYKNPFDNKSNGKYLINAIKKISFDNLALNEIIAEVISENTNAINFYKKHGFIYLNSEKKYNKFINDYENIEIFTFKKESFKNES